ncbi:protein phosphatase 1 regulatory subunit 3C [Trichomycterus rosablanca]|uniref:protein phosphatase 1 regulatory subunit 3C n=1 Tax=Trichomycterus rosablanca TaxID=2290929 RepID=UPI002F35D8CC
MSAAKLLTYLLLSPFRVMPVELSMHMCQSPPPSVDQILGMSFLRTYRSLQRPGSPSSDHHWARVSRQSLSPTSPLTTLGFPGLDGTLKKKKKKRVVFADDKGLALTAVRYFTADPSESDAKVQSPSIIPNKEPSVQCRTLRYRLGFPQPSGDSDLLSLVKLENCQLVRGSLLGKVRVRNISSDKTVHVRITFDSWRTYHDIQCIPMHQTDGNPETELFLFTVSFPTTQNLQDRLEFRVSLRPRPGGAVVWDDNNGKYYQILVDVVDEEEEFTQVYKKPLLAPQFLQSGPSRMSPTSPYKPIKITVEMWNSNELVSL